MNLKSYLLVVLVTAGTVAGTGCVVDDHYGHGRHGRPNREYITDARIEDAIRSQLAADRNIDTRNITVSVHNGNVKLFGVVGSRNQIERAGQIAGNARGVRHVTNRIQLR